MIRRLSILVLVLLGLLIGPIVAGALRTYAPARALDLQTGLTDREDLRFPCGNTECAGWLFRPSGEGPHPAVILGHGFAGTRDVALDQIALALRDRGMAAFVFDYRNFGASGGAPRQLVDPTLQVADWNAAIAFVKDLPGIDPARIAVYGSSMGAGHALITAAKRDDVQAVVAQVPLIDTRVEGEATFFGVGWVTRLLATAWGDLWLAAFGAEPVTIPAIAPSGGFGMLVDDRAYAAFETLVRPGLTYRNAVVARSIFTFDDYNPAIQAAGLTKPVLLIASRADRFAPFSAVETFAKAGPNRAVHEVNCDHFEIYVPPCSTDAHAAAVQFLHGVFAARSG